MKKKKIVIPLICVVCVIILVLALVTIMLIGGYKTAIVRCYVTGEDSIYMLYDDRLVKLNYKRDTDLQTGDNIFVIFESTFAESFPEQTNTKFILKVSGGTSDDLYFENDNMKKAYEELGFVFD